MKILNLVIKDPLGKIVRKIDFKETGVSFIYGDIQEPKNLGGTINSLGKTILIKCIDYICGANEDSKVIKKEIQGFSLEAIVKNANKIYNVKRILGSSDTILVNDESYPLQKYKDFFNIERSMYSKQIILSKKAHEISNRTNPSKEDYISFIRLLGLDSIIEGVENIYDSQDKIKLYNENKKDLVKFYGDFDIKQIDEEIYFIDKEVERLTNELGIISKKIKNIEISELQTNIIEEHSIKSLQLKKIKRECERARLESIRLAEFIDSSNKIDVTSEHILAIYNKTNIEVPKLIKKRIEEVEEFHRKVFDERKDFLSMKKENIQKNINKMEIEITGISTELDQLGQLISINKVYQESISLYEKYNKELQEKKYREGKLSQIKNVDNLINKEDSNLVDNFSIVGNNLEEYNKLIEKYRDFIYSITKSIYDKDVNSYFDIKLRNKHKAYRPVILDLSLKGDTGEGVGEVKKNLMDYLIFKYNLYIEILVQDSSCYNGIDPRQILGMLQEIDKIAKGEDKQAIICINKFQVGDYDTDNFIKTNSAIVLSEKKKLFGFDFD